jgi:hypothetical protein
MLLGLFITGAITAVSISQLITGIAPIAQKMENPTGYIKLLCEHIDLYYLRTIFIIEPMKQYNTYLHKWRQGLLLTLVFLTWPFIYLSAETESFNPNTLKLKIAGNGYSDETIIYFNPMATTGFDPGYDAYKLMGIMAAPQLYSIIDCCKLSINALPELYNSMIVQLGFRVGVNTNYTITATGVYTFATDTIIFLEDTKENQFINLTTDSVFSFSGVTTDDTERFKLHFYCPMKFNLRAILEGPFDGTNMQTFLNMKGMLPLSQPYHVAPWNYGGTETVASIPNPSIVDWILVELRDAPNAASAGPSAIKGQHACFLMNDGTVRGLDGISMPLFSEVFEDSAFVVIRHRNHLGVMSSTPLQRAGDTFSYDFAIAGEMAYGTSPQKLLGPGLFGLYAGNASANSIIDLDDLINGWWLFAGIGGYENADLNMDGQVENRDKNEYWFENTGYECQIP